MLEVMGSTIVHVGQAGAGHTVKATNQLLTAVTIQAVAHAVVFLEAHSVDPTTAIGALAGGLAGSASWIAGHPTWRNAFRPGSGATCTTRTSAF